jgi:hypothetical protein
MYKFSLSRKGFDSSSGGIPSPIINGKYLPLPIPEAGSGCFYKDLYYMPLKKDLLSILFELGARQFSECHMDPNLRPSLYGLKENEGWLPAFGQDSAALSHLVKGKQFGQNSVFIFFGQFRETETDRKGKLRFTPGTKPFHAIYGFMEVGDRYATENTLPKSVMRKYRWHPHVRNRRKNYYTPNSTLFLPAEKSAHKFKKTWGLFKYDPALRLSVEGKTLRTWNLPQALRSQQLSYFSNSQTQEEIKSPGRGQEFVGEMNEEVISWLNELINRFSR